MIRTFLEHCRRPEGAVGRLILHGMNRGHGPLSRWALSHVSLTPDTRSLDVGCGGGATLARLLRMCPQGFAAGLDHSPQSVIVSRRKNRAELGRRCDVVQGDVGALPFPDGAFDLVTAFETVYFWPDLPEAFGEIRRVLRPGGRLLLACEMADPSNTLWTRHTAGMTIYAGEDLRARLEAAGFSPVRLRERGAWCCLTAHKPDSAAAL